MSKKELIMSVAEDLGATQKDVKAVVELFFDKFMEAASSLPVGEKISIPGFGAFVMKEKKARTARNPKTGETVNVPAGVRLKFKPAKALKEAVKAD